MNRTIVYPSAIPLDTDILQPQQNAMIAAGYALQAAYGQNTVFVGLPCTPTSPSSMQVTVGPGAVIAPNVVETTSFGSLPADSTDPLVKMGITATSTPFTLSAPTTSGQSQNYLIEGSFSELDDVPATLIYFNSLNPNQPFSGPANSGTPQNTRRSQIVSLQLKPGVPANSGTQVTPPVDNGWIGLYVITVNFGQTAVTASSISIYPNAPFLSAFLSSHHGGVPGQAPKINLASEVQGVLGAANLPSSVGSTLVFAGNPNTHVAGTAVSGTTPPQLCWDTADLIWWTCVTSGTSSSAVWASPHNAAGVVVFSAAGSSSWTVPSGVTRVQATVVGGGGGGGGCSAVASTTMSAGPGGNGGSRGIGIYSVTPGQSIPITIGVGGTGGTPSVNGVSGGTSSFGSFLSAPGGTGGNRNPSFSGVPFTFSPPPSTKVAVGGNTLNAFETSGYPAIGAAVDSVIGGGGGVGYMGTGGAGFTVGSLQASNGAAGSSAGGGGGGAAAGGVGSSGNNGGVGAPGIVILEY